MQDDNNNRSYKTGMLYQGNPRVIISAAGAYMLFIALTNIFSAGIGVLAGGSNVNIIALLLTALFGLAALVVTVGLFWRRSWAPQATVIINALNVIVSVLGIVQTQQLTLFSVLFVFISGLLIALFAMRDDIKSVFDHS